MQQKQIVQAEPMAPQSSQRILQVPLDIVGGNRYGRYPKINQAQTWNMMISDGFLVDYAGFKFIEEITENSASKGRGDHVSTVYNLLIAVAGNAVVMFDHNLVPTRIGTLSTSIGDVYIAENNNAQIAFSDGVHIYIYNIVTQVFTTVSIDFVPGFLSFQNTYFLCASVDTFEWRLSSPNDGTTWPEASAFIGQLQTKPDTVQAVVPMPGRGNMAFVFGTTVAEQWTFTGQALFPYSRNASFNLDYGCINPASIAYQGNYIVWIGISEEAGPVIMYTTGGDIKEVSTDGIDFLFSTLKAPQDCSGFLVKLDGHLFYQVTFKTDNITLSLDLTNETFFTITDENMNYHPARKIVYFNNTYYFVSYNDSNLYAFGTQFTNYQYEDRVEEIPRVRICSPIRFDDQMPRIFKSLGFTIEQGQPNTITESAINFMVTEQTEDFMVTEDGLNFMVTEDSALNDELTPLSNMVVFLGVSRDGGETFGNNVSLNMNPTGQRKSRFIFQRLGRANDFTPRLQFVGFSRYVVSDGIVECYR
jgi:hypothetical protein